MIEFALTPTGTHRIRFRLSPPDELLGAIQVISVEGVPKTEVIKGGEHTAALDRQTNWPVLYPEDITTVSGLSSHTQWRWRVTVTPKRVRAGRPCSIHQR